MIVITRTHISVSTNSEMYPLDYHLHMIMAHSHISVSRILEMYPLDRPFHSEMYPLDRPFHSEMYPLDYPLDYHFHMIMAHSHISVSTNSEMTPLNYLFHEFIWLNLTVSLSQDSSCNFALKTEKLKSKHNPSLRICWNRCYNQGSNCVTNIAYFILVIQRIDKLYSFAF
jgi:hypothetical protein